ncbi:MAG: hypothetical protein LBH13_02475, partial [Cellulomonadaceae bacterium]|nr:hypothetical protein [Cellulomonadaceae bacterium]
MSPAAPSTLTGGVGGRARGPAHARPRTRRRWGRRIALVLAGMMAVMGMGACATYHSLRSAITVSDAGNLLEASRPQESGAATILVIGTDYRGGANRELAGEGGEFFADSTLLIHLAPEIGRA